MPIDGASLGVILRVPFTVIGWIYHNSVGREVEQHATQMDVWF